MIIIDRIFISINIEIKKIITNIFIRDLKPKIHYFDEFVVFTFYIKKMLFENKRAFTKIIKKIYIINNLKIGIFIKINIFISKRINIDFVNQSIFINNYRRLIVFMNFRVYLKFIKQIIKILIRIIILFRITIQISIIYFEKLFEHRNIFFESQYSLFLKHIDNIYIYIINILFNIM